MPEASRLCEIDETSAAQLRSEAITNDHLTSDPAIQRLGFGAQAFEIKVPVDPPQQMTTMTLFDCMSSKLGTISKSMKYAPC